MRRRNTRWLFFLIAVFFLGATFVAERKGWTAAGFFASGAVWYWLARRMTRELDAPPRRRGSRT